MATLSQSSLPEPSLIRERIATVKREDYRHCLETAYLYAGRICEVVGDSTPSDNTVAVGPRGNEVSLDIIEGHEVALFKVRTAKRGQMIRVIAVPLEFEPLARPLYDYFKSRGNDLEKETKRIDNELSRYSDLEHNDNSIPKME